MNNFKNALLGITLDEKCFLYLKEELLKDYSFGLVLDMLSLPCMKFETQHTLSLLFALLEDNEVNDTIVSMLCQHLADVTAERWPGCRERLGTLIEGHHLIFNRSQLMLLAHTLETMYAKVYEGTFRLLHLTYQRIPLSDVEFNPDSDDNMRIRLAKIAYSTTRYNVIEKLDVVDSIKRHLKASDRKHLLGMLNYYKGICLEAADAKDEFKDSVHYICKARNRGFELANIYLNYRYINLETSKNG